MRNLPLCLPALHNLWHVGDILRFDDRTTTDFSQLAHHVWISAQFSFLDRGADDFDVLHKLSGFANIVAQRHAISARNKGAGFAHKRFTALARLNFDFLIYTSDDQARLINGAIEIARRNQKLHWLLAGV